MISRWGARRWRVFPSRGQSQQKNTHSTYAWIKATTTTKSGTWARNLGIPCIFEPAMKGRKRSNAGLATRLGSKISRFFPSIDTNDIMTLSDTAVQRHLMHVLLLQR